MNLSLHRMASAVKRRLTPQPAAPSPIVAATAEVPHVDFVCNVCGNRNAGVLLEHVLERSHLLFDDPRPLASFAAFLREAAGKGSVRHSAR